MPGVPVIFITGLPNLYLFSVFLNFLQTVCLLHSTGQRIEKIEKQRKILFYARKGGRGEVETSQR